MDTARSKLIDFETVQVTQTGTSQSMEKNSNRKCDGNLNKLVELFSSIAFHIDGKHKWEAKKYVNRKLTVYCLKRQEFDFPCILGRTQLAVIEYSANVGRQQIVIKNKGFEREMEYKQL
ncbi:hypothetical protein LSH36_39g10029 [Paralvinella palmiformis]|uniref:Uncharacterized protein n=1 Tax=Paralvinella palmiformis TaxID=53620 RepID=A0AAD9K857_9ANNE|nr:hypothetical protein LSH36_39g10029 [Paralvinella palmiformis]